jgi:hypothetical protein
MAFFVGFRLCSVSSSALFFFFLVYQFILCYFLGSCKSHLSSLFFLCRYHHDIESYNIKKPLIIEGFGKVKDAVSSFMGNHEQAAEVAGGVNIVSDGIIPLVDESASNDINEEAPITTATQ